MATGRSVGKSFAGSVPVVPDGWRERKVRLSDEAWSAVIAQARAEVIAKRTSAPSTVVEEAVREYLGLDNGNASTADNREEGGA